MPPEPIQPMPMPSQWLVDHTPGGEFVVMVANRPSGTDYFFLQPESVEGLVNLLKANVRHCNRLRSAASNGGSGLVVPSKVILDGDGNPLSVIPPSPDVQAKADEMGSHASAWPKPVDEDGGDDAVVG